MPTSAGAAMVFKHCLYGFTSIHGGKQLGKESNVPALIFLTLAVKPIIDEH